MNTPTAAELEAEYQALMREAEAMRKRSDDDGSVPVKILRATIVGSRRYSPGETARVASGLVVPLILAGTARKLDPATLEDERRFLAALDEHRAKYPDFWRS
jgi:hypothetical protein